MKRRGEPTQNGGGHQNHVRLSQKIMLGITTPKQNIEENLPKTHDSRELRTDSDDYEHKSFPNVGSLSGVH